MDSCSDVNEYQVYLLESKGSRFVGLTIATDCLENLGVSNFWNPQSLPGLYSITLPLVQQSINNPTSVFVGWQVLPEPHSQLEV
jgi:hypothetical protein